jgi:predicted transcriptional regulator
MLAKDLISNNLPVLVPTDKVYNVLNLMDVFGVSHLPIVIDGQYKGLISEEQLYQVSDPSVDISNCKYLERESDVLYSQHIFDVLQVVSRHKLTVVPVLDDDGSYFGSIISFDLLSRFNDLFSIPVPGTVIVLELNSIDYSLSQIAQIVEYNNSKVLSMYSFKCSDSRKMELTLKIESDNIASVLESFNRYEYIIKSVFAYNNPIKNIYDDRYDNLMNYLSV